MRETRLSPRVLDKSLADDWLDDVPIKAFKHPCKVTAPPLSAMRCYTNTYSDDVENQLFIETLYKYTSKYAFRGHQKSKTYKKGYSIYSTDYFEE